MADLYLISSRLVLFSFFIWMRAFNFIACCVVRPPHRVETIPKMCGSGPGMTPANLTKESAPATLTLEYVPKLDSGMSPPNFAKELPPTTFDSRNRLNSSPSSSLSLRPSQSSDPQTSSGWIEEAGISSWPETVNANAAPVTEYHHRGLKSLRLSRPL